MRPLRIIINCGRSTRICDPAVAVAEPRGSRAFPCEEGR